MQSCSLYYDNHIISDYTVWLPVIPNAMSLVNILYLYPSFSTRVENQDKTETCRSVMRAGTDAGA